MQARKLFSCDTASVSAPAVPGVTILTTSLFTIPFVRTDLEDAVSRLQDAGVTVYATALDASIPFGEVQEGSQMAFILGNEGQGVHPRLQKLADQRIRIEMQGFESLNVAVAGGIVMYRFRAQ